MNATTTAPMTTDATSRPTSVTAGDPILRLYFVLTLGLSWLLGGLAVLMARGAIPAALPPLALLTLGGIGPLPVALALVARESGWAGVRALLARTGRWRVGVGWYAVALLGPALVVLTAYLLSVVLALATGDARPAAPPQSAWLSLPILGVVYLALSYIEEIGWRGFAQPRLQRRLGALPASLVLGVIWGLWHLPQWFVPATGQADKWPFAVFFGYTMALSVAFGWLYNSTGGSVLLVILAHAATNLTPEPWAAAWQALPSGARGPYPAIVIAAVVAVAAIVVALRTDPRTLTRERQRQGRGTDGAACQPGPLPGPEQSASPGERRKPRIVR
jgi:uncharacterized protein